MTVLDFTLTGVFILAVTGCGLVLGRYMTALFTGGISGRFSIVHSMEKRICRICGIDSEQQMDWKEYALYVVIFSILGFIALYIILICQGFLPLNPGHLPGLRWHLALNTAFSFVTNTNWQAYSGETTLSILSQMAGLAVQNFLSAATGIAVLLAFIRGITGDGTGGVGNFGLDITRTVIFLFLPLSIIIAIVLVSQGVVQTLSSSINITALEGVKQAIPLGPVASQEAIKLLGTNGGGFFNANSAHPFENPTPLSNLIEMICILAVPAGLVFMFGRMTGSKRQGYSLYAAMMVLFLCGLAVMLCAEHMTNPVTGLAAATEGKDVRFGITGSVLFAQATTGASCGAVNAMHDSLSPLSGLVTMFNIMLGEITPGGVGSGLYGMLMFVIITVFIAGLMVGRTPEYLGKKIGKREIQMAMIAVIIPGSIILIASAISVVHPSGLSGITAGGPHGLSQVLYAFSSTAGNNGSAFAGLTANSVYYNIMTAVLMVAGRFGVILPVLASAGSMADKGKVPPSNGTIKTDTVLFVALLLGSILVIGALTFFPALCLGPMLEHMLMMSGRGF